MLDNYNIQKLYSTVEARIGLNNNNRSMLLKFSWQNFILLTNNKGSLLMRTLYQVMESLDIKSRS